MKIKWGKHLILCERFHVSNGIRQGEILSPYFYAVYLNDLSNELNNIKAGHAGEVLLYYIIKLLDVC